MAIRNWRNQLGDFKILLKYVLKKIINTAHLMLRHAISSEEQGGLVEDGGPCPSHCHEDGTDLVHGLIRELSSLKLDSPRVFCNGSSLSVLNLCLCA